MTDAAPEVRVATTDDAPAPAALLTQLGYPNSAEDVAPRLRRTALVGPTDVVLVACLDGGVVGLGALHAMPLLHRPGLVMRLTAFVVDERVRRCGVGSALLGACERHARNENAERLEVTSGDRRTGAHAFYGRHGYARDGRRFAKPLGGTLA